MRQSHIIKRHIRNRSTNQIAGNSLFSSEIILKSIINYAWCFRHSWISFDSFQEMSLWEGLDLKSEMKSGAWWTFAQSISKLVEKALEKLYKNGSRSKTLDLCYPICSPMEFIFDKMCTVVRNEWRVETDGNIALAEFEAVDSKLFQIYFKHWYMKKNLESSTVFFVIRKKNFALSRNFSVYHLSQTRKSSKNHIKSWP